MLTKTIEYEDFNGEMRKEKFYFNLTEAEAAEIEMSTDGGLSEMIQRIVNAQEVPSIIRVFKDIILKAYGEKSDDGKRFMKVKDGRNLSEDFAATNAYSVLFMELATDPQKAADFFNSIIPGAKNKTPDTVKAENSNE